MLPGNFILSSNSYCFLNGIFRKCYFATTIYCSLHNFGDIDQMTMEKSAMLQIYCTKMIVVRSVCLIYRNRGLSIWPSEIHVILSAKRVICFCGNYRHIGTSFLVHLTLILKYQYSHFIGCVIKGKLLQLNM